MLTKGAIGNLVNRYRAVLTKCNLINTFGSLAVASMLVMGGAGVASATPDESLQKFVSDNQEKTFTLNKDTVGVSVGTTQDANVDFDKGVFFWIFIRRKIR